MLHGVYFNESLGVWGLFIEGEWQMISVVKQDCVDEAKKLGYDFN